jgi:hypothetical protein
MVSDQTKINAGYYNGDLLPLLLEDCNNLLQDNFVFQQDGAPAHTARQTQEWRAANCPDFIGKDEWPPNSPDLNPMDFSVWGMMLAAYQKHRPKPKTKAELKDVLQQIRDSLSQNSIDKAILGVENGCKHVWRLTEGTSNSASDKFCKEFIINGPFQGPHNKIKIKFKLFQFKPRYFTLRYIILSLRKSQFQVCNAIYSTILHLSV